MTKPQIMFVDDDPSVLDGLRRQLWRHASIWEMHWAASGAEALDRLGKAPIDVLVTDVQMPGLNGAELLEMVRTQYPGTARLVLSGHAGHDAIIAAAGPTQQYLSKPCAPAVLEAAVNSALRALHLMDDPGLRSLIGSLASLPKPPRIYTELRALLAAPDATTGQIAHLISRDVSTSTEVLKLVNSSFFGLATAVSSIDRAVTLLGLDVIQALVLAGNVFTPSGPLPPGLDAAAIADHGLRACLAVRRIGHLEGWDTPTINQLGLATLLHDVGLLVLASAYPDRWDDYRRADPAAPERARQTAAFGCSVGQSSAYLLELWGFPQDVVTALAMCPVDLLDPAEVAAASPTVLALAVARGLTGQRPVDIPAEEDGAYLDEQRLATWWPR